MISRRQILSLPVALLLPAPPLAELPDLPSWPLWSALGCHGDLVAVGLRCRGQWPHIGATPVSTLAARFAEFPGAARNPAPDRLRAALRAAIRTDYASGQVLEIDSWRLSCTEAELSALASWCFDPSDVVA
jgi:hypothetical protein